MKSLSVLALAAAASDDRLAITAAAALARRHASTARAVDVFNTLPQLAPTFQAGGAQAVWRLRLEDEVNARGAIAALVSEAAERFDRVAGSNAAAAIELAPPDDTTWTALKRELPLADFVVVAPSLACGVRAFGGPLGEALMDARSPVLIARAETLAPGRPAAVAWDGSFEAGHAVRAALPLLREASRVAIVQQVEEIDASSGAAADPRRVERYLAGHDIAVETTIETRGRSVGAALLQAAEAFGAELLVAGAYGHSRVGEALVGGATRDFLSAKGGPHLLLAH